MVGLQVKLVVFAKTIKDSNRMTLTNVTLLLLVLLRTKKSDEKHTISPD
jgi:hypothetical protein